MQGESNVKKQEWVPEKNKLPFFIHVNNVTCFDAFSFRVW